MSETQVHKRIVPDGEGSCWLAIEKYILLFWAQPLPCSTWAALTKKKTQYWVALNSRNLFSYSSGAWELEIRVPAWLGSGEKALPGVWMAVFSPCAHKAERRESESSVVFLLISVLISR